LRWAWTAGGLPCQTALMDQELPAKLGVGPRGAGTVFSVGHNTRFEHRLGETVLLYTPKSGVTIEHVLRGMHEEWEGDTPFSSSDEDWVDRYLPLLTAIESGINSVYDADPDLSDKTVIAVLERLVTKPDVSLGQELSTSIQDRVRLLLSVERYSRREVIGCLKKVQKSARLHHAERGPRGYLDFIRAHLRA
jgi:hypothetical protein